MVSVDGPREERVRAWFAAAARAEVEDAIAEIHRDIAEELRRVGPLCLASGRCCRFEAHGHRLYASGLEVARCVSICRAEGRGIGTAEVEAAVAAGNCPWQQGRLCTARGGRPTGCRVYFCDPRLQDLVPELAERAHDRIRALHERIDVPYVYGEWRAMLQEVLEHE